MHPRIQEVLEYLDTTRTALSNAVEQVAPARRDEQPAADRWSVAQVLDHLAIIEGRIVRLVAGRITEAKAAGLGPEVETSSVLDSINRNGIRDRSKPVEAPEPVRPQSGRDAASGWQALEQSRSNLRAATLEGDGLALSEVTQQHPVLGLINLYQWLIFVGAHEARHTDQISEIAREFAGQSSDAAGAA
jgi:uncharacterized damage-inducible protein DinB